MMNVKDVVEFQLILENTHTWAMRVFKPLISSYIDQWRHVHLSPSIDTEPENAALLRQQERIERCQTVMPVIQGLLETHSSMEIDDSKHSKVTPLLMGLLVQQICTSERQAFASEVERIINEKISAISLKSERTTVEAEQGLPGEVDSISEGNNLSSRSILDPIPGSDHSSDSDYEPSETDDDEDSGTEGLEESEAEYYQELEAYLSQESEADVYQESEAEEYQDSEAGGYQESEVGGYQESEAEEYQESEAGGYQESETGGYQKPRAESLSDDELGGRLRSPQMSTPARTPGRPRGRPRSSKKAANSPRTPQHESTSLSGDTLVGSAGQSKPTGQRILDSESPSSRGRQNPRQTSQQQPSPRPTNSKPQLGGTEFTIRIPRSPRPFESWKTNNQPSQSRVAESHSSAMFDNSAGER
jgi:hypothetical protein